MYPCWVKISVSFIKTVMSLKEWDHFNITGGCGGDTVGKLHRCIQVSRISLQSVTRCYNIDRQDDKWKSIAAGRDSVLIRPRWHNIHLLSSTVTITNRQKWSETLSKSVQKATKPWQKRRFVKAGESWRLHLLSALHFPARISCKFMWQPIVFGL